MFSVSLSMMIGRQLSLMGLVDPRIDGSFDTVVRQQLDETSWIEMSQGWLAGHDAVFEEVRGRTLWHGQHRVMYERVVQVPRLTASLPRDGAGHPILDDAADALGAHYEVAQWQMSLAFYRDGRDSVAWHGDKVLREQQEALVAVVSLGAPRRFLLRPRGGGSSVALNLGWGDLLVMGGACQRRWQHCVPKVASAGPRISVMFRPTWCSLMSASRHSQARGGSSPLGQCREVAHA